MKRDTINTLGVISVAITSIWFGIFFIFEWNALIDVVSQPRSVFEPRSTHLASTMPSYIQIVLSTLVICLSAATLILLILGNRIFSLIFIAAFVISAFSILIGIYFDTGITQETISDMSSRNSGAKYRMLIFGAIAVFFASTYKEES